MWILIEPEADLERVRRDLQGLGLWTRRLDGRGGRRALEVAASSRALPAAALREVPGVEDVLEAPSPHPRVDAQAGRPVAAGPVELGPGLPPVLLAGPCSVESEAAIEEAADLALAAGARLLRGGAYKPRTSPYAFAGHGRRALGWLRRAARARGLGVVTEVLAEEDVEAVAEAADLVQVGSRSMQSFGLLRAVGRAGRPVLLKRGMGARIEEWLLAGEHLLAAGAPAVVFCERGVVGFDPHTRNLLDLGAVALLSGVLRQPVVVDPSHAAGRRDLILPLSRAALAAGAHGLLVEVHPNPADAESDGPQALDPEAARALEEVLTGGLVGRACAP